MNAVWQLSVPGRESLSAQVHICGFSGTGTYTRTGLARLDFSVIYFRGVVTHTLTAGVLSRALPVSFEILHAASRVSVCVSFIQFFPRDSLHQQLLDSQYLSQKHK